MKYRIVEKTYRSGKVEFIPQYRFLWGWEDYTDRGETISFSSLQDAEYYVQRKKEKAIKEEEERKANEVISQKVHQL